MSNVNDLVLTEMANIQVPWRTSSSVNLSIGRTSMTDLPMDCFLLNNLSIIGTLKPSFMFCLEDLNLLEKAGDGGNGLIIASTNAQSLEYKKIDSGKCDISTYFFGMPKEGRVFDWIYRLFEHGFRIKSFSGFDNKIFNEKSVIDISVKKSEYTHPGVIYGKLNKNDPFKIPARIRRVK